MTAQNENTTGPHHHENDEANQNSESSESAKTSESQNEDHNIENHLWNAAYTTVGLGVLAYNAAKPQIDRVSDALKNAWDQHAKDVDVNANVSKGTASVSHWLSRAYAEGKTKVQQRFPRS